MEELYGSLEQKTATIVGLESEKEILSAELASTRELSKIHQYLQVLHFSIIFNIYILSL